MDPEGKRTTLCNNDPTFMLYRIAQVFGLPVVPEWEGWFNEGLRRHGVIKPLLGLGCSPVLISGTKKLFLKWIGRALKQKRIALPESNGPVRWNLASSFFRVRENEIEDESLEQMNGESPVIPATQEGELCVSY